jgi:hypothetical protein
VPSRRPAHLLVAAALAAVLPLSACGAAATSHSSRCADGTCTVALTGEQTFEVDGTDGVERDLGVGPIEPGAVTLTVYGSRARLAPGQSARLDDVPVDVVSVAGRDVTLRIGATEVEGADDADTSSARRKAAPSTGTKSAGTKSTSTKSTSTKSASTKSAGARSTSTKTR